MEAGRACFILWQMPGCVWWRWLGGGGRGGAHPSQRAPGGCTPAALQLPPSCHPPGCSSRVLKSTVRESTRAGVPVLSRSVSKPSPRSASVRPVLGASPARPACSSRPGVRAERMGGRGWGLGLWGGGGGVGGWGGVTPSRAGQDCGDPFATQCKPPPLPLCPFTLSTCMIACAAHPPTRLPVRPRPPHRPTQQACRPPPCSAGPPRCGHS